MFTGIIEEVGRVAEARDDSGVRRVRVQVAPGFLDSVAVGDSIAVDGACFTPVAVDGDEFTVEIIESSLARTVAGGYVSGRRVNLERAMVLGQRLDGHLVQGHVDGIGHLRQIRVSGATRFLEFRVPAEIAGRTILHGSIALNGISLTVNRLEDPDRVEVGIIPLTWERTNLRDLEPGDPVNVEGDLIGKYVGRLLDTGQLLDRGPGSPGPKGTNGGDRDPATPPRSTRPGHG